MKIAVQPHIVRQLDKQIARMERTIERKRQRLAELKATRAKLRQQTVGGSGVRR